MSNFERLMLAAQVRQIASELRDSARDMEQAQAAKNSAMSFNKHLWDAQHPIEEFIPKAIAELMAVDAIISSRPGQAT